MSTSVRGYFSSNDTTRQISNRGMARITLKLHAGDARSLNISLPKKKTKSAKDFLQV